MARDRVTVHDPATIHAIETQARVDVVVTTTPLLTCARRAHEAQPRREHGERNRASVRVVVITTMSCGEKFELLDNFGSKLPLEYCGCPYGIASAESPLLADALKEGFFRSLVKGLETRKSFAERITCPECRAICENGLYLAPEAERQVFIDYYRETSGGIYEPLAKNSTQPDFPARHRERQK